MKAKELLAALNQLSKEDLELTVYSRCDQGEQPEYTQPPTIIYFEEGTEPDEGYTNNEKAVECGWTKRAIIL